MRRMIEFIAAFLFLCSFVGASRAGNDMAAINRDCGEQGSIERCEQWQRQSGKGRLHCNLGLLHYRAQQFREALARFERCRDEGRLPASDREQLERMLRQTAARVVCLDAEGLLCGAGREEGLTKLATCFRDAADLPQAERGRLEALAEQCKPQLPQPDCGPGSGPPKKPCAEETQQTIVADGTGGAGGPIVPKPSPPPLCGRGSGPPEKPCPKPLYKKWQLWVGVGAVVAGAVTLGLVFGLPGKDICDRGELFCVSQPTR